MRVRRLIDEKYVEVIIYNRYNYMRRNGMAVFEVTRDYLEKFVDTQIEKN